MATTRRHRHAIPLRPAASITLREYFLLAVSSSSFAALRSGDAMGKQRNRKHANRRKRFNSLHSLDGGIDNRNVSIKALFEPLEDRRLLFANAIVGHPIHEGITNDALSFLSGATRVHIIDGNISRDVTDFFADVVPYVEADRGNHFDGSSFSESAHLINQRYANIVESASPTAFANQSVSDAAAREFGELIHAVQDFYAHSTWSDFVHQGLLPAGTIVDSGSGYWTEMFPYSVHTGVMTVQGDSETPQTDFGIAQLSSEESNNTYTVWVETPLATFPGIITGSHPDLGDDDTPNSVARSHSNLNKDNPDKPYHALARELATKQTTHEFYRLVRLVEERYGSADHLVSAWTDSDSISDYVAAFVQHDDLAQGRDGVVSVNTGDVAAIDLVEELNTIGEFKIDKNNIFVKTTDGVGPRQEGELFQRQLVVEDVQVDTANGDKRTLFWRLRHGKDLLGTIVFADRFGQAPFNESGRFYFAPATQLQGSVLGDANPSSGFQGQIALNVVVDQQDYELILHVTPGFSINSLVSVNGNRPVAVSGTSDHENIMRLQQRLNYLGFPDDRGNALDVDGFLGKKTRAALHLFKAAIDPMGEGRIIDRTTGKLLQDDDLDKATVGWLNNPNAPRWVELTDPGIPQEGPFPYSYNGGDFDLLPARDPQAGDARNGRLPQPERFGTSWMIDTVRAATAELDDTTQIINGISTQNGIGSG